MQFQHGSMTFEVLPQRNNFVLKGPRGAVYRLVRNQNNPHLLFATNAKDARRSTPFDGRWFSDESGELVLR